VLAVDTRSWRGRDAHPCGHDPAAYRRRADPTTGTPRALLPFILLGTVMGLSWWEDHLLPPAEAFIDVPTAPEIPVTPPEISLVDAA